MNRDEVLDTAKKIVSGDRHQDYGDAAENFHRIVVGWSVILGTDVTLAQVALCMDWVKTARLIQSPDHADSWVDKAGYSALGAEVSQCGNISQPLGHRPMMSRNASDQQPR